MPPKYRLLALDLDGTLLNARSVVSPGNAGAVRRAREAGMRVLVCTGRGLAECRPALAAIEQVDPVVVAGGAITSDPVTGRTLHRDAMDEGLVRDVTGVLHETGHAALILKDPAEADCDYLVVTGPGGLRPDPVSVWWFEKMGVRVRFAASLDEDDHPEHTVRVGVLGGAPEATEAGRVLAERFGGRVMLQSFHSVVGPEVTGAGEREVRIMEAFDPGSGKWPAIRRIAARFEIDPAEIAAIGDEMNDLEMVREAGLGVAMANARDEVRGVANRITGHHDGDGVAEAIDRILEGAW